MQLTPLPYRPDSAILFAPFATEPWSLWLDSGSSRSYGDRYDILLAAPLATLLTDSQCRSYLQLRQGAIEPLQGDPFMLAQQLLQRWQWPNPPAELPFGGGLAGYWGYELNSAYPSELPQMALGLYGWAVVVDHLRQQSWWVVMLPEAYATAELQALRARLLAPERFSRAFDTAPFTTVGQLSHSLTNAEYHHAFGRIQHYLRQGDCYQINLTRRYSIRYRGDPWHAYCGIRQRQSAPFGAFMRLPQGEALLSHSPERFLRVSADGEVVTEPIKGTRPRHAQAERDQQLARELQLSCKDRAENVMIVDLLRHDIGRHCDIGSVKVPALCALQSHPNVHHLVSTVTGRLSAKSSPLQLLADAFPGGSVTGAPKIRAMEIIAELEHGARNLYCGSLGYVSADGRMETNIAIRSAYTHHHRIHFHAGGGITIGSDSEQEYAEMEQKAQFFIDYFAT
ncbi:aminodeoxychorismate synthase component I [Ectothiorhodospiraceae bacterium BW-2]|nr:aminodeoxychorismate synthase component I [Ectothiorhodospiraceae bacterium BW-2]